MNYFLFIDQINNNSNSLHFTFIIVSHDQFSFKSYANALFIHFIYFNLQNKKIKKGTDYPFKFVENSDPQNFRY